MAHVLFLTPYYPPEVGAPQTRISETATRLAQRGYEVTVLTTMPNYPTGIVPPAYRHGRKRLEVRDGVRIVRVWSYITPNRGFLRRIVAQLSFGCLAPVLGSRVVGRPDVIIVESPPLFDGIAGRLLSWQKRAPFIFTVSDIWPESAIQLGILRNRLAIWLAEQLEWSTYRHSSAVWAVTVGIRQRLIRRGLSAEHVFLLPNGVDVTKFRPLPSIGARADLGWSDVFTVLYAGTLGLAHGLNTLLGAAEQLKEYPDIRFVLVGEGAAKADLMHAATIRNLTNVTFLDAQPHARVPQLIAAADACLVSLRNVPLFEGALPSKMYEAMACARPIILAVNGEARDLIEQQAGAAIHVEPEDPAALAEAVLRLKCQPELAHRLGEQGREFVQAYFDRDKLVDALEARIAGLLKPTRVATRYAYSDVLTTDKR